MSGGGGAVRLKAAAKRFERLVAENAHVPSTAVPLCLLQALWATDGGPSARSQLETLKGHAKAGAAAFFEMPPQNQRATRAAAAAAAGERWCALDKGFLYT